VVTTPGGLADQSPEGLEFGSYYYEHDCGIPYERSERWLEFFDKIARRIAVDLRPTSVLDAGCALGMLVEGLRHQGIDAYGVDVSEYAIDHVDPSIREFVWRSSLTEPLSRRYDLVVCVEVIEHLPADEAEAAIDNLCASADRILISSSPHDYGEATHVNVKQPEEWATLFARRGFLRAPEVDASFLTPWAVVYERRTDDVPDVVRSYERDRWQLSSEVRQLRETALTLQHRLEESAAVAKDAPEIRLALLETRDELIAAQAELGEALGRIQFLDAQLSRYRIAAEQLDKFTRSPVWRVYGPYDVFRKRTGARLRRLLGRLR
jgi:SAM-dependent methyltransferase